jgi:hypothetical protein
METPRRNSKLHWLGCPVDGGWLGGTGLILSGLLMHSMSNLHGQRGF